MDTTLELVSRFPVRKTKHQKAAFREATISHLKTLGYDCHVEKGSYGARNLVFGNTESADFLITAHYDTCARLPVPNLITPCNAGIFVITQLLMVLFFALVFLIVTNGAILLFADHRFGTFWGVFAVLFLLAMMLLGPANKNNVNDNSSGVLTLLEIARCVPENQRKNVAFALFDLEEAGLIGSASYRRAHKKATNRQLILNLDCVGDGDEILLFPSKFLKKNSGKIRPLYACCGYFGNKSILVRDKGFAVYPSDQMHFPYGVGIAALKRWKKVLYLDRIHTCKDTVLDQTNVNILRAAIISMICCGAVKKG